MFSVALSILIFFFGDKFAGLKGYGLIGLFFLSVLGSATIFIPAPVILTAFTAGAVFNPLLVTIVISLGATIGELSGYAAGYGAKDVIEKDLKLQKVKKWLEKYGLWALFLLAAVPNPIFDAAGIVAGATKIPIQKYLLVVFTGKVIKFAIFAYFGAETFGVLSRL